MSEIVELKCSPMPWKYVGGGLVLDSDNHPVAGVYTFDMDLNKSSIDKRVELDINGKILASSPSILEQLIECQKIIDIMIKNNIGRGRLLGKTFLVHQFNKNKKLIDEILTNQP